MKKKSTHHLSWTLRALLVTLLSAFSLVGYATIVTYNGINYYYQRATGNPIAVSVSQPNDGETYVGDENGVLEIPETFSANGKNFKVTSVRANGFLNCTELKEIRLPSTCVTLNNLAFAGCSSLEVSPWTEYITNVPGYGIFNGCTKLTELTIPANYTTEISSGQLAGSSIKTIILAPGTSSLKLLAGAFIVNDNSLEPAQIERVEIYRPVAIGATYNTAPFHNYSHLKEVVIGGELTELLSDYFVGCANLQSVVFAEGNKVSDIGTAAFSTCRSLQSITLPAGVTVINPNLFYNCSGLTEVNFQNDITSIGQYAFAGTTALHNFVIPETVTSIGQYAFANGGLEGEITVPGNVRSVGSNAFAGNNNITAINIPASVNSIGDAAFAPIMLLSAINVDAGNTAFKMVDGALVNAAETRVLATAHEAEGLPQTLALPNVTSIDTYGMSYAHYTAIDMPALVTLNPYAFYRSKLAEFTYKKEMELSPNVFKESALEVMNIENGVREVPQNLCMNCEALAIVNFSSTVTNVMQNAFEGCTSLEEMFITTNINYIEKGGIPATIKKLYVYNANPPVLSADVFNASQSEVECHVAPSSAEKFQDASQWRYLNIIADESISSEGSTLGCPSGLYFATTDGRLMYKDTEGQVIDTEFKTGDHALNLSSYKNRIYVATAGKQFRYQNPTAGMGDGEVFYVNKTNDLFYRVTVLNNVGYEAFEDPFCMFIEEEANKIYISDRNVGIHEMSADTVGLYGSQPFFAKNNWLPYYNNGYGFAYGALSSTIYKRATDVISTDGTTRDNVYWVSKKFNGYGIFRFSKDMLYTDESGQTHPDKMLPVYMGNLQMTSFYVDEKNEQLYFWLQADKGAMEPVTPGLYRIPLATLNQKQDGAKLEDALLIDDSPVKLEGAGDEITGVPQIIGDGNYIYWAYVSPESDDASKAVPNSVAYDASNPLHHTGIKRAVAVVEDPTVAPEIAFEVEGIAAYGLALANFVPDVPEPPVPTGDLNGDGNVNTGDVSALYTALLNGSTDAKYDLNGDGNVNTGDVSTLYSIILGN